MSRNTSPFKFLDAYQEEDVNIFFGRKQDTEALYDALSGVKHLLVYGPSGAGKTSLVECGLRNQFSDADWFALSIRRGTDMAASVFARINEALQEKLLLDPDTQLPRDPGLDFGQAIESLFAERYQPVYLLFDQFEELLISGREEEKKDFFTRLNRLIRYKVPCRVLLIMREEFIGHLSEFEPLCPSLFQHRFRLEKMTRSNVQRVIQNILEAPYYRSFFKVEQSALLAGSILSKLPDERREIELAHVQVFLGELWERANSGNGNSNEANAPAQLPTLHQGLIRKEDKLEGVLDSFLKKQLAELAPVHGETAPIEVLGAMISERHTKLQLSEKGLQKDLDAKEVQLLQPLQSLLNGLQQRRIIRTLKSGNQTQYEISHDVLAFVVGQNLTEEMKMREKAREIYRVFEDRQGFFSQDDLDYIRPYQVYLAYPPELKKRIGESEAHWKQVQQSELEAAKAQTEKEQGLREDAEQAKKQAEKNAAIANANALKARRRARVAILISLIAIILAATAYSFYQQTLTAKEQVEIEKTNAITERDRAAKSEQKAKDLAAETENQKRIAEEEAQRARDALEQQRRAQITAYRSDARQRAGEQQYPAAIQSYLNALELAKASGEAAPIRKELEQCRADQRLHQFNTLRDKGLRLAEAGECSTALIFLRQALEIERDDKALRAAQEKCRKAVGPQ